MKHDLGKQQFMERIWESHDTSGDHCTWCKRRFVSGDKTFIGKIKGKRHDVGMCCLDRMKWVEVFGVYWAAH